MLLSGTAHPASLRVIRLSFVYEHRLGNVVALEAFSSQAVDDASGMPYALLRLSEFAPEMIWSPICLAGHASFTGGRLGSRTSTARAGNGAVKSA